MFDDFDFEFSPYSFITAGVGLIMGVIMLKYGGLHGMGLLGKLGMILGSTIGGFLIGLIMFRD